MHQVDITEKATLCLPERARILGHRHAFVAIAVLLLPFVVNSIHAVPSSDDFCYASQVDKVGHIDAIRHYYNNVNGRFFATTLIVILNALFPISQAYSGVPLIFLSMLLLAAIAALRATAPRNVDFATVTILGVMYSIILVTNAGALSEVIYWLSGGATYLSVTACTLATLACMIALARRSTIDSVSLALTALGVFSAIAAVGSMESAGPVLIVSTLFGAFAIALLGRPGSLGLCIIGVSAAVALWLNLTSAGTAVRADTISLNARQDLTDFIVIVLRSGLWTTQYLLGWASNASVWILALALHLTFGRSFGFAPQLGQRNKIAAMAILAGFASLPYLAAFPMFYAYSVPHPTRAHTYIDALCILFWLTVLILAFRTLSTAINVQSLTFDSRRLSLAMLIAFCVTVAGTSNFYHASMDMFRGAAFARQATAQINDVARDSKRGEAVIVARSRTAYAPTLAVSDITPDPRRWRNVCFAEYLGAYGVRTGVEPGENYELMPQDWTDPDPQAIGRPRPVWP